MQNFDYSKFGQQSLGDKILPFLLWLAIIFIVLIVLAVLLKRYFKKLKEKNLFLRNRTLPSLINNLRGVQFEIWVKELLLSLGITARVTGGLQDHGIDVEAFYQGKKIGFQCKLYFGDKLVGEHQVRDLYGAQRHGHFDKAVLITTGNFSLPALKWAEGKNDLVLINAKLLERIILNRGLMKELLAP